jgi:hypothetical protein
MSWACPVHPALPVLVTGDGRQQCLAVRCGRSSTDEHTWQAGRVLEETEMGGQRWALVECTCGCGERRVVRA